MKLRLGAFYDNRWKTFIRCGKTGPSHVAHEAFSNPMVTHLPVAQATHMITSSGPNDARDSSDCLEAFMGANHMKYLGWLVLLVVAQTAAAQDWARAQLQKSPRHQEWVTVKHDGRS